MPVPTDAFGAASTSPEGCNNLCLPVGRVGMTLIEQPVEDRVVK